MPGLSRRGFLAAGGARLVEAAAPVTTTVPGGLDVRVLQTASSVERGIITTYEALLALPLVRNGRPILTDVLRTTLQHHNEHLSAFQAQTVTLGGKPQAAPNPKVQALVARGLASTHDVVKLSVALEQFATDTYLFDLGIAGPGLRGLLGSVMLAEAQHLAAVRLLQGLVEAGNERLVAIPTELADVPRSLGTVGFPKALHPLAGPDGVAQPDTGAVK